MTIPSTIISVQDYNNHLNKSPTSQFSFNTSLQPFSSSGTKDILSTKTRILNPGYHCLIKGDGVNGSTAFSDSTKTFTLIDSGGATISTATSKFGGASVFCSSTTRAQFQATTVPTNMNLAAWSGDWTYEFFCNYQNGASTSRMISRFAGVYDSSIRFENSTLHAFYFEPPSNIIRTLAYSLTRPTNQWVHVAFVKFGTALYLYYQGTRVRTSSCTGSAMDMRQFDIGRNPDGSEFFEGYLDEIRFSNFARYTASTYTVPTSSYV